jgi:hypothetical protein
MYLLWAGLCLISAVIVYFFVPETARLPIEEIGALFGDEVVVHLTADGHGIVEEKEIDSVIASAHGIVAGVAGADSGTTEERRKGEKGSVEHEEVRDV